MSLLSSIIPARLNQPHFSEGGDPILLSAEDIQRKRLIFAGVFAALSSAVVTGLQISVFPMSTQALVSIANCVACVMVALSCIWMGWRVERLDGPSRTAVLVFAALIWIELFLNGGILGFKAPVLLAVPVVSSLILKTRDAVAFTALNIIAIIILMALQSPLGLMPAYMVAPDLHLYLTAAMFATAAIACGFAAVVMMHQNGDTQQQLRELLDHQSHLAAHDHLSGLGNRAALQERFDAIRPDSPAFDLLLIDLDGFKAVNDTFGHNAGDYLIKEVAQRLHEVTDSADMLVRLGGDEFVVMIETGDNSSYQVRRFGDYLIDILSRPYSFNGAVLRISASIGHARYPIQARNPSQVLSLADKALYAAKGAGKRICVTYGVPPVPLSERKKKRA